VVEPQRVPQHQVPVLDGAVPVIVHWSMPSITMSE
jgi:hypothetical protein